MSEDYKVKKGDNLTQIAREKGITLEKLIEANPQVKDPNLIFPGEKLNIPGETRDIIGENIAGIPQADYGVPTFSTASESEDQQTSTQPEPLEISDDIIKTDKKYYTPTPPVFDGNGSNFLDESVGVPNFQERNGDRTVKGIVDNNTIIVFGRDRNPFSPNADGIKENSEASAFEEQQVSGYSNYMGAGAIDIVVGRGAPYPLSKIKDKTTGETRPFNLPPLYLTRDDMVIKGQPLRDGFSHPGYVMDAARIYISQMCHIDEYFNLPDLGDSDFGPHSAIIMKADKLRMHSRRDVKIVAGGDRPAGVSLGGKKDSNGFEIVDNPKIHLIAGNGDLNYQQPIPLGYNLVECLEVIVKQIESLTQIVNNFYKVQKDLNAQLQEAKYPVPGVGMTTHHPLVKLWGIIFQAQAGFDQTQITNLFNNLNALTARYLRGGGAHINSPNNTTN